MPQVTPSYPTDPVEVILSDGKPRAVRFTAAALRRLAKRQKAIALDSESTEVDQLIAIVYEGLIDKGDMTEDDVAEMIDARGIEYLNEKLAEVLPKSKNPPVPASPD